MSETRRHNDPVEWWTLKECAARWKVSVTTVASWCEKGSLATDKTGHLLAKRFGRQWRVCFAAVLAFEADGVPIPAAMPDMSAFRNVKQYF